MKKPSKPRPKRRARKAPPTSLPQGVRPRAAVAVASAAKPLQAPETKSIAVQPLATVARAVLPARGSARPRNAASARAYTGDERNAFALLLLPFLIVAVSLGMSQSRRTNLLPTPDMVVAAPPLQVPGRIAFPPPVPDVPLPTVTVAPVPPVTATPPTAVASLDVRPPPAVIEAPPPAAPGPAPLFPPPQPEIPLPLAVPTPVPLPVATAPIAFPPPVPDIDIARLPPLPLPVATSPIAFPPPVPAIEMASLDVRPPPLPAPPIADASPASIASTAPSAAEQVCSATPTKLASFATVGRLARHQRQPRIVGLDPEAFGQLISAAALEQTRDLVIYTARYQPMAYPMGDVLALHGACIDVLIRAYRAVGIDLQEEVQRARPSRGDPNIDHRRTENVRRFLERHGASLPITEFPEDYKPGDIVTYYRPFSRISTSHIAIVTDQLGPSGRPMIVHNRGYGPQLEDALFVDRITGHYRYMGPPESAARASIPSGSSSRPVVRTSLGASQQAKPHVQPR